MTIKPLTPEETAALWDRAENALACIAYEIEGRCYGEQSLAGIRYVMMSVRRSLVTIDLMLLELEAKKAQGV